MKGKMKALYYINQGVFNIIEAYVFYLVHFKALGQKLENNFVCFLGK